MKPGGTAVVKRMGRVSSATLVSRALGYARDALVAHFFGGGYVTDAFYAAFRLPNLFRRLLGEGSLTPAFVPVFSEYLARGQEKEARALFWAMFWALGALLWVMVLAGVIAAPALTYAVAWGFKDDPGKFELTVGLTRTMFPFLLFICLAALSSGALNALGRFFVPAVAPAMLSVAEIGFVLVFAARMDDPVRGLAISAVVGGALHLAVLFPVLRGSGLSPQWKWDPFAADIKRVAKAVAPAAWGLSVDQINAYIDTICASFLIHGSVTALYNSNRLMQFPLSIFGIAASTAALPALSLAAAQGRTDEMRDTLRLSLRVSFFAIVPAMAGLIALGIPIVELLFQHGRFTHRETLLTNAALVAYALGLPAFASAKILASAFYALKDTKTPVKVASYCLAVNVVGNLLLMDRFGVGGLAFATTMASVANAGALFLLLRKRIGGVGGGALLRSFWRSSAASAVMAAAAFAVAWFSPGPLLVRVPSAVVAGALVYGLLARWMNMDEWHHWVGLLRRRKA